MSTARRFSPSKRAALYLLSGGRCCECDVELDECWHADHVFPFSKGGETDVVNGQALCPACNLKKGAKVLGNLREWQANCLAALQSFHGNDFLVSASPGAGKTRLALEWARRGFESGRYNLVIIVCPSTHLKHQWAEAAFEHASLDIRASFTNGDGALPRDYNGCAVTYAAVSMQPELYRAMSASKKTLVILDEVHHAGDDKRWGDAIHHAFEVSQFRLSLSGTPFRGDRSKIPFVRYEESNEGLVSQPDFSFGYRQALVEGSVRKIAFRRMDGIGKWRRESEEFESELDTDDEEMCRKALDAVLDPAEPWVADVLREANAALRVHRRNDGRRKGLVIARSQYEAREYAKILERIAGKGTVAIAISDDEDAHEVINGFAHSDAMWLVSIRMVSEGVDIPQLTVGAYLTTVRAELSFRQVVGRFIRKMSPADRAVADLFVPNTPAIRVMTEKIAEEVRLAVLEVEDREPVGEGSPREVSPSERIGASNAVTESVFIDGEEFTAEEIANAQALAGALSFTEGLSDVAIAQIMRATLSGRFASEDVAEVRPVKPKKKDDRVAALKKRRHSLGNQLASMRGADYSAVHNDLRKRFGRASESTEEQNRRAVDWLKEEIERQKALT